MPYGGAATIRSPWNPPRRCPPTPAEAKSWQIKPSINVPAMMRHYDWSERQYVPVQSAPTETCSRNPPPNVYPMKCASTAALQTAPPGDTFLFLFVILPSAWRVAGVRADLKALTSDHRLRRSLHGQEHRGYRGHRAEHDQVFGQEHRALV